MDRVRGRIGDKRVLGLVKAFLKAGILSEDAIVRDTDTGTPQGGILSPLLANIALSVLDDHFVETWQHEMATVWQRKKRRQQGRANSQFLLIGLFPVSGRAGHSGRVDAPRIAPPESRPG